MTDEIDVFKCLDYIRDHANQYATAKANRCYLEEYRKVLKARIMLEDQTGTIAKQEAQAYAHPDYKQLLDGLKVAIEEEEKLKWLLEAAKAKVSVWQTLGANKRVEAKVL